MELFSIKIRCTFQLVSTFGMMHKNNEKIAFYLISLLLSLYYVYFADTNTFHYFTIKIITR